MAKKRRKRNIHDRRNNDLVVITLDQLIDLMLNKEGKQVQPGDLVEIPCYSTYHTGKRTKQQYIECILPKRAEEKKLYEMIWSFRCTQHPDNPGEYKDSFRYYAVKNRGKK